jgi:amylosucrase
MDFETAYTLERLLPRLEQRLGAAIADQPAVWAVFVRRLQQHFERLFDALRTLYGEQYDFFYYLEELLIEMAKAWFARPAVLRELDGQREANPDWFQSNEMLGGVLYVDLFAGDLQGLRLKLPYFKELDLTYLHLMPLFQTRPGDNDGGYAISNYRAVDARLGTMDDLRSLAEELRQSGISLVLDFVLNHTSDDHPWAQRARQGDPFYRKFYYIFPDRTQPDRYEQQVREIFPDEHAGAFSPLRTQTPEGEKIEWVWTTFHTYQWDLNYSHLATFNQMVGEMLFLANVGVDVLRFDALAFVWKEAGTVCESLPKAHVLLQAFNAVTRIAAPGLLFKSEAIVHPDQVVQYVSAQECQLSYNPLLMALLWNTLATREVNLLQQALRERHALPAHTAWVNYVRCHDDIGWTFSDEDAVRLGILGSDHRRFLNAFYTGRFPGSFGRGVPFQENPKTGDCRISGTCASLAGLEKALMEEGPAEVELALRRIGLLHGVILTVGGIPLIYLGDEIGQRNDYSYRQDVNKAHDSRWVHRLVADEAAYARRQQADTIEGRLYAALRELIRLRKQHSAFAGALLTVFDTENRHVLCYERRHGVERVVVLANFSEQEQSVAGWVLAQAACVGLARLHGRAQWPVSGDVVLPPFDFLVLG